MEINVSQTVNKINGEANEIIALSTTEIVTEAQYNAACDAIRLATALLNKMDETFDPIIKSAHKVWQEALNGAKLNKGPIETAKARLKATTARWLVHKQEAEAREKELLRQANETIGIPDEPIVVVHAQKKAGTYLREDWYFEVTDKSKLPLEFLVPDTVKLNQMARALKGTMSVPGGDAKCVRQTVAR